MAETFIAVPLADESDMRIGYITHKKGMISRLGNTYLEALKKYLSPEPSRRKLEHRGRFNELGRDGEMLTDVTDKIDEHIKKLK